MINLSNTKNFISTNYHISRYTLQAMGNHFANRSDAVKKRRRALEITTENSRELLKKLNFNINIDYLDASIKDRNFFMVCNHMSYFDIVILSSIRPSVFVTSVEMEKTFFLGDIAKMGGSFFVDRVNRRKMKAEVQALVDLLNQGFNVFIFPEGTSTDGSHILPFKKSLFRVPFQTQFPILPICLRYESINGEPFSPNNCDRICWYDDMTFAPHFMQLMGVQELTASVTYLKPLRPPDFEDHGALAASAQKSIESIYFRQNLPS